jgi:murein DD-endopeptidase MepM/ murein hydrolase activator NlpD
VTTHGRRHRAGRPVARYYLAAFGLVLAAMVGTTALLVYRGTAATSNTDSAAGLDTGAPGLAAPARSTPTASPTPSPTTAAPPHYVFPVVASGATYAHTHHDYPASDIMAPCGSPNLAVTDGVILEVSRVDTWNPKVDAGATRGGLSVSLLGDDGVRYYGSHYASILPEIVAGVRVHAGQQLGVVGKTGDASACHLHFGISPVCARTGDWWTRRGEIWPWPYLDSWRAGGSKSAVAEITAWVNAHGCLASAPPGA